MNNPNHMFLLSDEDFAALIPVGENQFADADGNVYMHLGPEIGAAEDFIDDDDGPEVGRRRGRDDDDDRNILQRAGDGIRQKRRNRLERVDDRLEQRQDNRDENRARRNDDDDDDKPRSSGRRSDPGGADGIWVQHSLTLEWTNTSTTAVLTQQQTTTSQSQFKVESITTDGSSSGATMGVLYFGDEPVMNTGGSNVPFAVFAGQNDRAKGQLRNANIGPGIQVRCTATIPIAATNTPTYGYITLLGKRWVPSGCH